MKIVKTIWIGTMVFFITGCFNSLTDKQQKSIIINIDDALKKLDELLITNSFFTDKGYPADKDYKSASWDEGRDIIMKGNFDLLSTQAYGNSMIKAQKIVNFVFLDVYETILGKETVEKLIIKDENSVSNKGTDGYINQILYFSKVEKKLPGRWKKLEKIRTEYLEKDLNRILGGQGMPSPKTVPEAVEIANGQIEHAKKTLNNLKDELKK